jgi:non-specific serine/threonine protein kinase
VRQYARERLEEKGEAAVVRGRHRDWFLALAERAAPELHRSDQLAWLERLEAEHDNLRAALEWCASEENGVGHPRSGWTDLRLAGALWRFWQIRGYWAEGRQWLEEALSRGAHAPPALRARALAAMAILTGLAGDYASRQPLAEEGLRLARAAPDPWLEAHFLFVQGGAAREERALIAAAALGEQSLALAREVGDPLLLAEPLLLLGMVAWEEGDCKRAAPLLTESLSLLRQMGDRMHMPIPLLNLGVVAMLQGDFAAAVAHCREGVLLSREFGDKRGVIWCLQGLAAVAAAQGKAVQAARMIGAVDATLAAIGHTMPPRMRAMVERTIATARAAIDESTYTTAWAEGRAMTLEQAITCALAEEAGN